jgi:hypothetical protein
LTDQVGQQTIQQVSVFNLAASATVAGLRFADNCRQLSTVLSPENAGNVLLPKSLWTAAPMVSQQVHIPASEQGGACTRLAPCVM